MKGFLASISTIVWKDVLLEVRTKDLVLSVTVFALLIIVVFSFAIDPIPQTVALIAPGVLWVSFTFGGVLGLTRSFALEKENGNIHGLMLLPIGRDVIFFGKMVGIFIFMTMIEIIVFPVFVVLFNLSFSFLEFVPVVLLATLGISAVGTLFTAITMNTRSREVMLPLLFFPALLPIIVAAVEANIGSLMANGTDSGRWLFLLLCFDGIFLVVCPAGFALVLEE